MVLQLLEPNWPAPKQVVAFSTRRSGGVSQPPYDSLNLGDHVGDDDIAVRSNRDLLYKKMAPARIDWLQQVHGNAVVSLPAAGNSKPIADGAYTSIPNIACAVMTADCLPILLCDERGSWVAAIHAGWRSLVAGIVENTVSAYGGRRQDLMAWQGPAIGPCHFEVGPEVRASFLAASWAQTHPEGVRSAFNDSDRPEHYLADLYALSRIALVEAGISANYGGGYCTYCDKKDFYSYRRDGETGRMATGVFLRTDTFS
ncbi:MAG: peptidoglycan editing factor PgeF [Pseudomonadales bacterium]